MDKPSHPEHPDHEEFTKFMGLYDFRVAAMQHSAKCHEYICSRTNIATAILTAIAIVIQVIKIIWSVAGSLDQRTSLILDAVTAACAVVHNRAKLGTLSTLHKTSHTGAIDMLEDMEFKRVRAAHSLAAVQAELRDITNKIAAYRVTEPVVPLWVKEKFTTK